MISFVAAEIAALRDDDGGGELELKLPVGAAGEAAGVSTTVRMLRGEEGAREQRGACPLVLKI